jgi:hypothetical protein
MHPGQSKMHPALIPGVHLVSLLALFAKEKNHPEGWFFLWLAQSEGI